ncbi:MAG: TMEM175 family protein [Chitinophagales bacterium]
MKTGRLEAFSDGVIAIIITVMVLNMKAPIGATFSALKVVLPNFISYIISFIYVGIYWNNHHHLFQAIEHVNGKVLWLNLILLFCLSLLPFSTSWMGDNHFQSIPVLLYGINLLLCAISFILLAKSAAKHEGENSVIGKALKSKNKENISLLLYLFAIAIATYFPIISLIRYTIVAIIWLIPDTRIERQLHTPKK